MKNLDIVGDTTPDKRSITNDPDLMPGETISPPRVLESNAGFYIGTMVVTHNRAGKMVSEAPYSRESGYYASYEAAAADLQSGDY